MKKSLRVFLAVILALGAIGMASAKALGQVSKSLGSNENPRRQARLAGRVRHALAMIPQFSVFDNLAYRVDGGTVTLAGQVRNAIIRDEAASSIKHIEGVERINNLEVELPTRAKG
ncbi:MAG TPA: BON domain-containing protein [Candidatus Saccharimonadales bacterium]|jgi:osmotically-inducible protein OsmY|nr:BON domain-containing protein [Candidatus Saccharimonadales bacterium]